MTIESIVSLVIALLVFTVMPGPGNFSVIARSLSGGMRVGVALHAENWSVTAWGRNVGDEDYLGEVIPTV